jgi:hypothetical protein
MGLSALGGWLGQGGLNFLRLAPFVDRLAAEAVIGAQAERGEFASLDRR